MAKNKKISGIFSDLLESVAIWFLYIFVDARANVPSAILQKRKKQIDWLRLIDSINPAYDFNQLVSIIQNGITKRYGVSPATLLSQLYNTATTASVGSTLAEHTATATAEAKALALQNLQVSTTDGKKNIWSEIGSIISALLSLFSGLGIVKSNSEIKTYTPAPNDWYTAGSNTSNAGMGVVVPVLLAGGVIYYLSTANGANKKTKK